jgi:hypothetical protein
MTQVFRFEIDWGNGQWTPVETPIQSVTIRRGRSSSFSGNAYAMTSPGEMTVTINDSAYHQYDLFNPAGYPAAFKPAPNRPCRFGIWNVGNEIYDYYLFSGRIKNLVGQSQRGVAKFDVIDGIDLLQRRRGFRSDVRTDYSAYQAIAEIIDLAEWPYSATGATFPLVLDTSILGASGIDDNGDTIPYWWAKPDKSAWEQITEVAQAFIGNPFHATDGTFIYSARNMARPVAFTLDEASRDMGKDTQGEAPYDEIRNSVRVNVKPRGETAAATEIYRLNDTPLIGAGKTLMLWAQYSYNNQAAPRKSVVAAASGTDYTANTLADGSGTSKTAQLGVVVTDYATEAKIELTNNDAADIYVTMMKLRGVLYIVTNETVATADDTTYQADDDFGVLSLEIKSDWMQEALTGQYHADYAKVAYSLLRHVLKVQVRNRWSMQFSGELYDRVTVNAPSLYIEDSEYQIVGIEHNLAPQNSVTTFRLEPLTLADYFTFSQILDATAILGW